MRECADDALTLNEDVYFCVTEGQGVFLDLRQDDYSAVPLPPEFSRGDIVASDDAISAAFEPFRADLIAAKLLVARTGHPGGFLAYQSITRPTTHIFHPDDQRAFGLPGATLGKVRLSVRDVVDFLLASRRAAHLLKTRAIHETVRSVRTRKAAHARREQDLEAIRRQTAIFRKLRPFYPRGYLCLYDALALIEFLARRRLFPTWVFGVQAQPFGAHCWVQSGEYVLNESTEYANQFTPLMTV